MFVFKQQNVFKAQADLSPPEVEEGDTPIKQVTSGRTVCAQNAPKRQGQQNQSRDNSPTPERTLRIHLSTHTTRYVTYMQIENQVHPVKIFIDYRMPWNIIGRKRAIALQLRLLESKEATPKSIKIGGTTQQIYTKGIAMIKIGNITSPIHFLVIKHCPIILGKPAILNFHLLKDVLNNRLTTSDGKTFWTFPIN